MSTRDLTKGEDYNRNNAPRDDAGSNYANAGDQRIQHHGPSSEKHKIKSANKFARIPLEGFSTYCDR